MTRIPTVISRTSAAFIRGTYQCSACWEVVAGHNFDPLSALCMLCATELGYMPRELRPPTPPRFETDADPLHTLTHPFRTLEEEAR